MKKFLCNITYDHFTSVCNTILHTDFRTYIQILVVDNNDFLVVNMILDFIAFFIFIWIVYGVYHHFELYLDSTLFIFQFIKKNCYFFRIEEKKLKLSELVN